MGRIVTNKLDEWRNWVIHGYVGKRVRGQEDDFHGCTCPGAAKKPNPSPRRLATTGLRTGSGSSGLSIPYSVRSTRYVRTMYVTLEYPYPAGKWGYVLERCAQYFALRARTGADHFTYTLHFLSTKPNVDNGQIQLHFFGDILATIAMWTIYVICI